MAVELLSERWFSFGDCAVRVRERPPAEELSVALVFVHGRFEPPECWSPLLARLGPRFHCVSVDLPGFGLSLSIGEEQLSLRRFAGMLRKVIAAVVQPGARAILIGHDYGGALVQLCALQWPEIVEGVILVNAWPLTRPPSPICSGPHRLLGGLSGGFVEGLVVRRRIHREIQRARLRVRRRIDEDVLGIWNNRVLRKEMLRTIRSLERTWPEHHERTWLRRAAAKHGPPALLLWGRQDTLCPSEECAVQLVREWRDATFYEDPESGHWPALENPEWVSAKTREFVFRLGLPPFAIPIQRRLG